MTVSDAVTEAVRKRIVIMRRFDRAEEGFRATSDVIILVTRCRCLCCCDGGSEEKGQFETV